MKKTVLVIGATGILGQAVAQEFERDSEVIRVGRTSGDYTVDITNNESIHSLYQRVSNVDAVVSTAASKVVFDSLENLNREKYFESFKGKLLGQIELVLQGLKYLGPDTSYTLTTGLLNSHPLKNATAAAMINAAVESFALCASLEVPKSQRINVVSPAFLQETIEKYRSIYSGNEIIPADRVALAFRESVMGQKTGHVFRVGWSL